MSAEAVEKEVLESKMGVWGDLNMISKLFSYLNAGYMYI